MANDYERDEFDEIAAQRGPVGVHRAPRSVWGRILPPVIVFLVAGAAAYGVATYLWNQDNAGDEPEPTPSITTSPTPAVTPSESPSPTPTPSPSPSEPELVVNLDATVTVLNGAGISGLAGRNAEELEAAGFTNVTPGNLGDDQPAANVVIYAAEAEQATAEEVARVLGIAATEFGPTTSSDTIEVQLVTDPDA